MTTYYVLLYKAIEGFAELKLPYRKDHLEIIEQSSTAGELLIAGALSDPSNEAILVFNDHKAAKEFAISDPYVKNGLIEHWEVRPWNVVINTFAS